MLIAPYLVLIGVSGHLVEMGSQMAESVVVGSWEMEDESAQPCHLLTFSLTLHHYTQELLESVT